MISCVVASVAEAELAGGFQVAQLAAYYRRILFDLGYPQPPTLIRIDNTVAIGLATASINAKRSKSMDMRFFWIIDRVKQGQFVINYQIYSRRMEYCGSFHKTLTKDQISPIHKLLSDQHGQRRNATECYD
jgi:hypothetical protein